VGRLIPAGTGAYLRSLQKIANQRDAELTSTREAAVEPLPADLQLELAESE
jgi:DNA-directed RNA polymerase subunit beta'